jgi:adenylosuccinate synthase
MHAVIGALMGDEGKGRVVDWLCSRSPSPPGVVRYSGGHQAAHRVVVGDKEHVFAHFGSGTLRGAPTYWSSYCPVAPVHLMNELTELERVIVEPPKLYIDGHCPVTTPYDVAWGRCEQTIMKQHGSCGMGIYATWKRERDGCHFLFEDTLHPEIARMKLKQVKEYFRGVLEEFLEEQFVEDCRLIADYVRSGAFHLAYGIDDFDVKPRRALRDQNLIFEGSQGLLLDQSYGFFPHVTPSNTGTQNVVEMLGPEITPETWLVTRAYSTRHGNGPFIPFESPEYEIKNPCEKNGDDGPQGKFRTGPVSLELLRYAVKKDPFLRKHGVDNVVVTCVDVLQGKTPYFIDDGGIYEARNVEKLLGMIKEATGAKTLWTSSSPNGEVPLRRI